MGTQQHYDNANKELAVALAAKTQGNSNNHAILACALYLRAITEMLGTKFTAQNKTNDGGRNGASE